MSETPAPYNVEPDEPTESLATHDYVRSTLCLNNGQRTWRRDYDLRERKTQVDRFCAACGAQILAGTLAGFGPAHAYCSNCYGPMPVAEALASSPTRALADFAESLGTYKRWAMITGRLEDAGFGSGGVR